MRVKTVWFRRDAASRAPEEIASVIASTVWRAADRAVDNLSRAGYDILTPARGFKLIAEFAAFALHGCDRFLYERVADPERAALIQAAGQRLADVMLENVRRAAGDDGYDHRSRFIGLLNRRAGEYAEFEFPRGSAGFPALRYLASLARDEMEASDRRWIMDSIMEIEAPEILGTMKKTVDGLLAQPPEGKTRRSATE